MFLIIFAVFIGLVLSLLSYGFYSDNSIFFLLGLIAVSGFGVYTIYVVRGIFFEIREFTKNTDNISDNGGNLLPLKKNDEFGNLTNSINNLSQKFLDTSIAYEEKIIESQITDSELQYKIQYLDETKAELSNTVQKLTIQKEIEKKHLRELEWRTKIVKSLAEEAKLADIKKSEFTSMISHELKTPLTPIISWCSILEQNVYGKLNEKQLNSVQKIHENSEKLSVMIGDLLDARKLDLEQMVFTFSDLSSCEIVQSVYDDFKPVMKEKDIDFTISCDDDFTLSGDRIRLEQVLKNFLTNAMDFVSEHGKIEIITKRNDPYVTFCVKDNGIGISKENQKNLFKKFYQVNASATREHGGSGLGLTICKGIVRGMNGLIGVDSEIGKGSTFYFSLPINQFAVPDPPSNAQTS